ncbi:hypothetical protein GF389_02105 [Candidatus Dojkabacteria bacterium]|nr:hypothetical protein [Candidatus Dojkabacteria bacterium]
MDEKTIKMIVETAGEIIEKLGMHAEIEAEMVEGDNEKNYLKIHIQGEELGLLIGFKGQGLLALQQYLTIIMSIELREKLKQEDSDSEEEGDGRKTRTNILVDVNDYKEKQEDQSRQTALRAIDQVVESGQPVELPPMNPAKRRIVHMVVSEDDRIESESVGENPDRRVVIKPID